MATFRFVFSVERTVSSNMYPDGYTLEEMREADLESARQDPFAFVDSPNLRVDVEVVDVGGLTKDRVLEAITAVSGPAQMHEAGWNVPGALKAAAVECFLSGEVHNTHAAVIRMALTQLAEYGCLQYD